MAKNPRKAKKPLAAPEPAIGLDAASPVDEPALNNHQSGQAAEAGPTATPMAKSPAEAAPTKEPPHLLTPLAALWPAAMLPESPKSPEQTPVTEKAPSAALQSVTVTFVLLEPHAKQAALSGDFNGWAADATPMKRQDDGHWEAVIALAPGRYEYKFVVDGQWIPDPQAQMNVWNQHGTLNSVIEIRP